MPDKSRGGNGLGTIRQRSNGRWEYRFSVKNDDGTSSQKSVYGATQKEAVTQGKKLEELYRRGLVAKKDNRTFGTFAQDWYSRKTRSGRAENTLRRYRLELKQMSGLNSMKLQAIKPPHIRKLLDDLAAQGIAPSSQRKVLERLKVIFREAARLELIHRNPAEFIEVEAPPTEPKGRTLEPWEIEKLLEACESHPMGLLFRLLLSCGLRKGEALALTWADIDLRAGELRISKKWDGMSIGAPKTKRSRRVVPIPNGLLARFKAKYQELLKDFPPEALKASYIFGDMRKDKPFEINSPNHALKRMVKRINEAQKEAEDKIGVKLPRLSPMRVHDLRHTYGSIMLSKKVPLELVSERLGHSNITVTLNIYRHLLEEERQGHVFDLEELLSPTQPRAQA